MSNIIGGVGRCPWQADHVKIIPNRMHQPKMQNAAKQASRMVVGAVSLAYACHEGIRLEL